MHYQVPKKPIRVDNRSLQIGNTTRAVQEERIRSTRESLRRDDLLRQEDFLESIGDSLQIEIKRYDCDSTDGIAASPIRTRVSRHMRGTVITSASGEKTRASRKFK